MKINIATSHRFHLHDLARELTRQGHDVRFYSYVPTKRCVAYGLSRSQCVCLLPYVAIFFVFQRIFPKATWPVKMRNRVMDYLVGITMRRCDVYIALGTVYLKSLSMAKRRFGATTILEWGSKHIDDQQRILRSIGAPINDEYFNVRSRKAYEIADYIAVASKHVVRSFVEHGIDESKLLRNPYGVTLEHFYPKERVNKQYDLIMVGGWSKRKGCDLLVEALRDRMDLKFLHVGSIVDLDFPNLKHFTHINPVNQSLLVNYYAEAKVFILPSREEGLAMVQAQAIACNLPIIGSKDSGAEDLREMVAHPEYITVLTDTSPKSILNAVDQALKQAENLGTMFYAGDIKRNLTWEAYGKRYSDTLNYRCKI